MSLALLSPFHHLKKKEALKLGKFPLALLSSPPQTTATVITLPFNKAQNPHSQREGKKKKKLPLLSLSLFFHGKMMNRSSANPSDPYGPSMMTSFAGQNHLLEYWENQSQTPFFDPQPSLFPMNNNFPFSCSPLLPSAEYPNSTGMIKREEIGLNLGQRTYFSSGDALTIDRLLTARAYNHQPPRCQAEGCKADLLGAKHYHRRHKVCDFHSKASVVIAGGMQQRFCQQCSRFHVLGEFDDSKRSCRKRLADHNRRRRKPQNQNPSTNSSTDQKTRHTTRPSVSKDTTSSRSTTTTTIITAISSGNSGFHGVQNKPVAALSLGGVDINREEEEGIQNHSLYQYQQQQQHHHFSYNQQSLFGSSSNIEAAASQSTAAGGNSGQHQTNLPHLGQAMFEVDFM